MPCSHSVCFARTHEDEPPASDSASLFPLPLARQLAEATGVRLCLLRHTLPYEFSTAGSDDAPAIRRSPVGYR